jgi:hypothetical protein
MKTNTDHAWVEQRPKWPKACRRPSQRHRRAGKSLLWIEWDSLNHIAELAGSPAMLLGLALQWSRREPETTSPSAATRRGQRKLKQYPPSIRQVWLPRTLPPGEPWAAVFARCDGPKTEAPTDGRGFQIMRAGYRGLRFCPESSGHPAGIR